MKRNYLLVSIISGLCFVLAVVASCTKDEGKRPRASTTTTTTTGGVSACDTVTYTKHIKKILTDYNCISCHQVSLAGGAPPLDTYSQVSAVSAKIKATVFDAVPELMPQGGSPLPQAQKDLITCWLNNGKKE